MKFPMLCAAAMIVAASPALAQETAAPTSSPVPVRLSVAAAPQGYAVLPQGTQVTVRLIENVTTSGDDWEAGDTFRLVVAHDIMLGQYIVIPAGSPVQGRITDLSSRGAFGRSGKMDVEIEHIVVQGQQIAVNGTFRQEGEGATLETLGGVLVAGIFAGFVTGESATIPNGRELVVTTEHPLELDVLASEISEQSSQISEADANWHTYYPYTDPSLTPSARVMQARQMRDAAIADARAQAAGTVSIVAAQPAVLETDGSTGAETAVEVSAEVE